MSSPSGLSSRVTTPTSATAGATPSHPHQTAGEPWVQAWVLGLEQSFLDLQQVRGLQVRCLEGLPEAEAKVGGSSASGAGGTLGIFLLVYREAQGLAWGTRWL